MKKKITYESSNQENAFEHIQRQKKENLIDKLVSNRISYSELNELMTFVEPDDLKEIVLRVFDNDEQDMLKKSAVEGILKSLNGFKNSQRNEKYFNKIKKLKASSSKKNKLVKIIAEGDSWFNYPIILSDIIDWVSMEENLAVLSLASGGDWLLNILASRDYVDGLSVHSPDFFLMSGGGNDVAGMYRLALMVDRKPADKSEFEENEWAKKIIGKAENQPEAKKWDVAVQHLSKDFFALLMLFRLQYYCLFNDLLHKGKKKYKDLKIITQGYDFLIPSYQKGYGFKPWNWFVPVLRLIGHGSWLKTPLKIKDIHDEQLQKDIIYAFIFLFNEMMIELEEHFNENVLKGDKRIFHIDSRELVKEDEWVDEIHPLPDKFKIIAQTYIDCINGDTPDYKNVFQSKNRSAKP